MNKDLETIRLAEAHLPLALRLARRFALLTHLPLAGLEQAALEGLHLALVRRRRSLRPFRVLAENSILESLEAAVSESELAAHN